MAFTPDEFARKAQALRAHRTQVSGDSVVQVRKGSRYHSPSRPRHDISMSEKRTLVTDGLRIRSTCSLTCPRVMDFFAAVRDVNSRLPADARIRVFGGEDNRNRDIAAVSILKEHVLQKHGKALVTYGYIDFVRDGGGGIVRRLDVDYPGRTFAVIPLGGQIPGDVKPDYQQFDRALKTQVRPVMVALQRLPFRNFTAEEFLVGQVVTMRRGRRVSIFEGSTLTLGEMADACVYFCKP